MWLWTNFSFSALHLLCPCSLTQKFASQMQQNCDKKTECIHSGPPYSLGGRGLLVDLWLQSIGLMYLQVSPVGDFCIRLMTSELFLKKISTVPTKQKNISPPSIAGDGHIKMLRVSPLDMLLILYCCIHTIDILLRMHVLLCMLCHARDGKFSYNYFHAEHGLKN